MLVRFQPTAQLKIAVTPECNNNCRICFNQTTRCRSGMPGLNPKKICSLIHEGKDLGIVGTYFTGGEPLVEFLKLLEYIELSVKLGMIPSMVTNGGLLAAFGRYKKLNQRLIDGSGIGNLEPNQVAEKLRDAGLQRVYMSIDANHNTPLGADSEISDRVPAEVAAKAIGALLDAGFGKIHNLDAIGHCLRISSIASGCLINKTQRILSKVLEFAKLVLLDESSPIPIYGDNRGEVLHRRLEVANIGDAKKMNTRSLDNRSGTGLFHIKCPHFRRRSVAYDGGLHHGDIAINHDGIVCTCGDFVYPVGDAHIETLGQIIDGVNSDKDDGGQFDLVRKVYLRLLQLTEHVGENAVGMALQLTYRIKPGLVDELRSKCGVCDALSTDVELQKTFINAFDREYGKPG